ncbi:TetR/AcrR family transcriptional regulator [Sphingopyxis sp.]|uniref:TetR/AcrR family transcriptional regulator n=1 Tax=Sphingopyxis sp. TaxID=1908224 RepID=UPI003BACBAAF
MDESDWTEDAADGQTATPLSGRAYKRRITYLYAAMRCIRKVGAPAATMEAIAAEAGVTRATIYREFSSRSSMLAAVTAHRFERFCHRFFARISPETTLAEKLELYFLASVMVALRNPVTQELVRGSLVFTAPGRTLHVIALRVWRDSLSLARKEEPNLDTLDDEDIVQWILVSQVTICRLALDTKMPLPRLRRYVRRFVLPAFGKRGPAEADFSRMLRQA